MARTRRANGPLRWPVFDAEGDLASASPDRTRRRPLDWPHSPKEKRLSQLAKGDRAIYLASNGRNKAELALRFNLTERRVEQIVAEQRAVHLRRIQPQLFDSQNGEMP